MAARDPPMLRIPQPDVPRQPVTVEDVRKAGRHANRLNNSALKSIRDTHEEPRGVPTVDYVDLWDHDPFPVKQVIRGKGMDYTLGDDDTPWLWRSFLNCMDDETLNKVVGPGIVGIMAAPLPGSYDHKRHTAARELKKPFPPDIQAPVWDFIVWRTDNQTFRLHPDQTKNKIAMYSVDNTDLTAAGFPTEPPRAGKGKSDGRGTYRNFLRQTYPEQGSFKGQRAKAAGKAGAVAPMRRQLRRRQPPDPRWRGEVA